ncbi:hypothetical protein RhiirA5_423683 [Rhizophagus irregularis]|uniref:Uncharacterized protein n=1 Tax=Rhizophagus irregularis TaxID=588596 RepID=A0A2N0P9H9_9GLOM|nr:hypothetical protein RhiirA5_423683 [Rhizophagus irregularis]
MNITTETENYIGYEALVTYLIETKNCWSYCGFLSLNQDTIIASLASLPISLLTMTKWQNIDIIWYTHFLDEAKRLLDPNDFVTMKDKYG